MSSLDTVLSRLWVDNIERCGFILQNHEVVEIHNHHGDPTDGFRIKEEAMNRYSDRILATWHTHPSTSANLSVPDYFLFCRLSQWHHVIIFKNDIRIYKAIGDRVLICEDDCI